MSMQMTRDGAVAASNPQAERPRDGSVSFAELVWAHHERQKEVSAGIRNGEWEQEYRYRLREFKREHGEVFEAYWCRFEASAVALTERKRPRRLRNLFRHDSVLRLHTATDWRTANAPVVGALLHEWEIAGIKAGEVLRGTSERIALHRIFAASSRLLGLVDREQNAQGRLAGLRKPNASSGEATWEEVERAQRKEIAAVADYYQSAGENSARIVYFRGMARGAAMLAASVGAVFLLGWALGWLHPSEERTQTLFVTIGMGAAGAILSVMTRMARHQGFNLEFEVGRKSVRFLGGLRPWIGAMFALALYVALKSSLLDLLPSVQRNVYFYATIAFLAGFSERRAKVLLDSTLGADGDASATQRSQNTVGAQAGATAAA